MTCADPDVKEVILIIGGGRSTSEREILMESHGIIAYDPLSMTSNKETFLQDTTLWSSSWPLRSWIIPNRYEQFFQTSFEIVQHYIWL